MNTADPCSVSRFSKQKYLFTIILMFPRLTNNQCLYFKKEKGKEQEWNRV